MSDTPRTDAAEALAPEYATPEYVHSDFPRQLERELAQLREQHQWHSVVDRPIAEWVDMSLFAVRGISGGQVLLLGHIDTGNIVDLCGDTTGYKWTDVTHWKRVEGPEL